MRSHLAMIEEAILDAITGRGPNRIIVAMPPRHGKSEFCSKYVPPWYLGTFPDNRVILASYEADFAAEWGGKSRSVLEEYGWMFGVQVSQRSFASDKWDLSGFDGGMRTAGANGAITGKGAHLLIIDDPFKNAEDASSSRKREKVWEFYQSTAYTRLEPGGIILVVQTRWHKEDLAGRLLKAAKDSGEQWREIRLPAIASIDDPLGRAEGEPLWPERYDLKRLEDIRHTVGPYFWASLYQQVPTLPGGREWPDEWFGEQIWVEPEDVPIEWRVRTAALDPSLGRDAKRGDYQAFTTFMVGTDGKIYIGADLVRKPINKIASMVIDLQQEFRADGFAIESNQFQQLLEPEIMRESVERETPIYIETYDNREKKEIRIRRHTWYLSQDKYRFIRSPGTELLVEQMRDFPEGEHDDGPDSLEMAQRLANELLEG